MHDSFNNNFINWPKNSNRCNQIPFLDFKYVEIAIAVGSRLSPPSWI